MPTTLQQIVDGLNQEKIRCTYGAVAEELRVDPMNIGGLLGERRPEVSWFVNARTHEPTGYIESEKHSELYRTDKVIQSAEELRRVLGL